MKPKFRVFDPSSNVMFVPDVLTGDGRNVFATGRDYENWIDCNDCPVMMATGLKDKNGKEIFEGDFIQNVADDGRRLSIFEIRWQQSCCGFVKEREDGHTFTLEISKYFEVIGNIHQNPELVNRAVGV